MKQLGALLFVLLLFTACQQDDPFVPVAELPFETHPSVLRGNWSGTVFNTPASKNVTLELSDLTAECADEPIDEIPEDRCYFYTFSGNLSLDGSAAVPVTGDGYAGDYIYTLTSPGTPTPPGLNGSFELGGEDWYFFADYRVADPFTLEGEPAFEGSLYSGNKPERSSSFRLEPTP